MSTSKQTIMFYRKETKGTVVFECNEEGAFIKTLYIKKNTGFDYASQITVTVEAEELTP